MPKLLIFDAFTLLIPEKTVANYALLRCKTFSLKIWVCKIFDKFHVCVASDDATQVSLYKRGEATICCNKSAILIFPRLQQKS